MWRQRGVDHAQAALHAAAAELDHYLAERVRPAGAAARGVRGPARARFLGPWFRLSYCALRRLRGPAWPPCALSPADSALRPHPQVEPVAAAEAFAALLEGGARRHAAEQGAREFCEASLRAFATALVTHAGDERASSTLVGQGGVLDLLATRLEHAATRRTSAQGANAASTLALEELRSACVCLALNSALPPRDKAHALGLLWRRAKAERQHPTQQPSAAPRAKGWLRRGACAPAARSSWRASLRSIAAQPGSKVLQLILAEMAIESDMAAALDAVKKKQAP